MITLAKPIVDNGKTIEAIETKTPTIGDLLAASKFQGIKFSVELLHRVTGISKNTLSTLPVSQWKNLESILDEITTDDDAEPLVNGDSYLVVIDPPIKVLNKEISELNIREPRIDEIEAVSSVSDVTQQTFNLLVSVTGLQKEILRELPLVKFKEAAKALGFFLDDSRVITDR